MSGLFRSTVIKGNRITDFAQTTATVGVVIPFGYGAFASDGNVIFAPLPPKETTSRKRQGKGGVKQETYTYTLSYAVAFAKGPISKYVWIKRNGKVVYTTDPNAPIEDLEYAQKWLEKATLYYGTRDQLPDSTIESYEGTGKVSAFRDLAYIVVEEDDVTEGGGAVPTYEACVQMPGTLYLTTTPYPVEQFDDVFFSSGPDGGRIYPPPSPIDPVTFSSEILGGELRQLVIPYEEEPGEITFASEILGGELYGQVVPYDQAPDELGFTSEILGGELYSAQIPYDAGDEGFAFTSEIVGGTLT